MSETHATCAGCGAARRPAMVAMVTDGRQLGLCHACADAPARVRPRGGLRPDLPGETALVIGPGDADALARAKFGRGGRA